VALNPTEGRTVREPAGVVRMIVLPDRSGLTT
jgi:hypothetical protein